MQEAEVEAVEPTTPSHCSLLQLPSECLQSILSHVDRQTLVATLYACKRLYALACERLYSAVTVDGANIDGLIKSISTSTSGYTGTAHLLTIHCKTLRVIQDGSNYNLSKKKYSPHKRFVEFLSKFPKGRLTSLHLVGIAYSKKSVEKMTEYCAVIEAIGTSCTCLELVKIPQLVACRILACLSSTLVNVTVKTVKRASDERPEQLENLQPVSLPTFPLLRELFVWADRLAREDPLSQLLNLVAPGLEGLNLCPHAINSKVLASLEEALQPCRFDNLFYLSCSDISLETFQSVMSTAKHLRILLAFSISNTLRVTLSDLPDTITSLCCVGLCHEVVPVRRLLHDISPLKNLKKPPTLIYQGIPKDDALLKQEIDDAREGLLDHFIKLGFSLSTQERANLPGIFHQI